MIAEQPTAVYFHSIATSMDLILCSAFCHLTDAEITKGLGCFGFECEGGPCLGELLLAVFQ